MKHNPDLDIDGSSVNNGKRAEWANTVMTAWAAEHYGPRGEDDATMARDLVSDICHWLHSKGMDPDEITEELGRAFQVFSEEAMCTLEHEAAADCPECSRSHGPHYRGKCEH